MKQTIHAWKQNGLVVAGLALLMCQQSLAQNSPPGLSKPPPSLTKPPPSQPQPGPGYVKPPPTWTAPPPTWKQPAPTYTNRPPTWTNQPPNWVAPPPTWTNGVPPSDIPARQVPFDNNLSPNGQGQPAPVAPKNSRVIIGP